MLRIIDVSAWQPSTIDWAALKAQGLAGGITKVSEGTYQIVNAAREHWDRLGAAGMTRGLYHYAKFSKSSPEDEAHYFLGALATLGIHIKPGDMIFLDIEEPSSFPAAEAVDWLKIVGAAFNNSPACPGLYSYPYFIQTYLQDARLSAYELWLASYPTGLTVDQLEAHAPAAPAPWTARGYMLWQWTYKSTDWGFAGGVDESVSFLGAQAFAESYGYRPLVVVSPPLPKHWELITAMHFRPQPFAEARPQGALLPVGTRVVELAPPKGGPLETNGWAYCRTSGDVQGWLLIANMTEYTS